MAKEIYVCHYNDGTKQIIDGVEAVVLEFKAFVSRKAANIFMESLHAQYPNSYAQISVSVLYTVESQPSLSEVAATVEKPKKHSIGRPAYSKQGGR